MTIEVEMASQWKPIEGELAWCEVFQKNVTVWTVYARTATVKVWGDGLRSDEWITYRGVALSSLGPRRRSF